MYENNVVNLTDYRKVQEHKKLGLSQKNSGFNWIRGNWIDI